ncbi:MAG: hypothetical protein K2W95_28340 [Candidatus Obscuribacterales bacterium]|nr:hypothetical protein [Candidatus Obscuribacterales bacterium]
MTDEFDYQQPEIEEENEGDEDGEGSMSSAAAAAVRMSADTELPPAHPHSSQDVPSSAGGALERAATASTPATGGGSDSHGEGGKLKPAESENLKELQNLLEGGKEKKSDVFQKLATGDRLVKDGKTQHLIMPNGDNLTVKPDGSYELDTKQAVKVKSDKGVTTITYANGDSVEFDSQGIRGIQRTNENGKVVGVSFARPNEMQHQHGELKPVKPGQSSDTGNPSPNIIRERPNISPNSVPESGSTQPPREARPSGSLSGTPSELSQEQLKKILRGKK